MSIIWDDSALINAFNASLAKYQEMHGLAQDSIRSATNVCKRDREGNIQESKAENGASISAEKTCEAYVSGELNPEDFQAACVDKPFIHPDCKQPEPFPSHNGTDIKSGFLESKEDLCSKIELLEQQYQHLQEYVGQLYNFMNSREYNIGSLDCSAQPPTQPDFPYELPYGSFSQYYPHYHYGLYPHPQCLWHNHHPVSTMTPCTQPPRSPSQDPGHVSAETLQAHFPAQAQSSSVPAHSSGHVVAEAVRDTLWKSLSGLPGLSAQTSSGKSSLEEDCRLSELLSVWFNAGFQTARYLQEKGKS